MFNPRPPCRTRSRAAGPRPRGACAARPRCGPAGRSPARGRRARPRGRGARPRPRSTPRRAHGPAPRPAPAPAPPAAPAWPLLGRRCLGRLGLLLEQAADGVARLRALADPVLRALGVDLHHHRILARIVVAQHLDEAPVAPGARVRDHDTVVRLLRRSGSSQSNRQHLVSLSPLALLASASLLSCPCVRSITARDSFGRLSSLLTKSWGALTRHHAGRSRPPLKPPSRRRRCFAAPSRSTFPLVPRYSARLFLVPVSLPELRRHPPGQLLEHLSAATELLHHLSRLRVLLQQAVHVFDRGPASLGDALAPAAVDDGRLAPLQRGHGV